MVRTTGGWAVHETPWGGMLLTIDPTPGDPEKNLLRI